MTDTGFLLDMGRCLGCQACVVACKTGNELGVGQQFIEIVEQTRGTFPDLAGGFMNHRCYHCAEAACVEVCPTGALFKDGTMTRLNRSVCSGCGYCVETCPFEVPVLYDGQASKCDGCADVVQAGGEPWCVKTCPTRALAWGPRDDIVVEARNRVDAIRDKHPRARTYGETEAGGLGVIVVLPDDIETTRSFGPCSTFRIRSRPGSTLCETGLPADPRSPTVTQVWQSVVQPAAVGVTAASAVAAGVAGVIARRNHMREVAELEAAGVGGEEA